MILKKFLGFISDKIGSSGNDPSLRLGKSCCWNFLWNITLFDISVMNNTGTVSFNISKKAFSFVWSLLFYNQTYENTVELKLGDWPT